MDFIKKHKEALLVVLICLILMVLAGFAVYRMFYPSGDKSVYGDRLQGSPVVSDEVISSIKEKIIESKLVNEVDYENKVKILKFYIDVKSKTKVTKAQDLSKIILENLSTEILTYYDIEIYLTQSEGEDKEFPMIGYHSKDASFVSWTTNKEGVSSEE